MQKLRMQLPIARRAATADAAGRSRTYRVVVRTAKRMEPIDYDLRAETLLWMVVSCHRLPGRGRS
jgi:hypothetical protein